MTNISTLITVSMRRGKMLKKVQKAIKSKFNEKGIDASIEMTTLCLETIIENLIEGKFANIDEAVNDFVEHHLIEGVEFTII